MSLEPTPTPTTPTTTTHTNQPDPDPETSPSSPQRTLRISTRSSALALAQTHLFTTLLSTHPSPAISSTRTSIHPIHTSLGDTNKSTPLHTLASSSLAQGIKSLWTEDLERELLRGEVDVIVHSLKDVPTKLPRGCRCSAVGRREEGRDCVVLSPRWRAVALMQQGQGQNGGHGQGQNGGHGQGQEQGDATATNKTATITSTTTSTTTNSISSLDLLPAGSIIGTSSIRRQAMLRRTYPHLIIKDLRGNVPTRIAKLDDPHMGFDAIVVAGAGVLRLGLQERISGWLDSRVGVLSAVGQGAIGVEWREGDEWVEGLVEGLRGRGKRERRVVWEAAAERELLRVLEGGCSVPLGVECTWEKEGDGENGELNGASQDDANRTNHVQPPDIPAGGEGSEPDIDHHWAGKLRMHAMVVSVDGTQCVQSTTTHPVNSEASARECGWLMAQSLVEKGAAEILKEITLNRDKIREQDGA